MTAARAGLRELAVTLHLDEVQPVGVLALDGRQVYFAFDAAFVASGRSLSPYALPVVPGLRAHAAKPGVPVPGVFGDSLPDGWGLRLLHRAFAARGRPRASLTALDHLAFLGDRAMGALGYEPTTGPEALFEAVELGELATHARAVYRGDIDEVLPQLLRAGGSPGGVRPKALIGRRGAETCIGEASLPDGFSPWLVKLERPEDDGDCARREAVWLHLARRAGIIVPSFETVDLGDAGTALVTRRFDRQPRRHLLSAAGALDVDFRTAVVDYAELGRLALLLSRGDLGQAAALVRRAAFNVVMGNDDDHLKNHAWLYDGTAWALSPAYDLTWSPLAARSTPVCGRVADVPRGALEELGARLGLPSGTTGTILDEVCAAADEVASSLEAFGCTNAVSRRAAVDVEARLRRVAG